MRLDVYTPYTLYVYSITQVLVWMEINSYCAIYGTQRDIQETKKKKTNFVVSQKATTACAANVPFAIFTPIRNPLGNATNKSCLNWTPPHFKTPTAQQCVLHSTHSSHRAF